MTFLIVQHVATSERTIVMFLMERILIAICLGVDNNLTNGIK